MNKYLKIMWIITLLCVLGTFAMLSIMPDSVPMHYDISGNVDRWGSKYENLIFPGIIIVTNFVFHGAYFIYSKKTKDCEGRLEGAEAASNASVMSLIGFILSILFTIIQGCILYAAYKGALKNATVAQIDIMRVSIILIGIFTIVSGNYMTKVRMNSLLGFRTVWSMYNQNTWRKSNRFGGFSMVISGFLIVIIGIVIQNSQSIFLYSMCIIGIDVIAVSIYSNKVYRQEIEAGGKPLR